jgi:hypothetical protein
MKLGQEPKGYENFKKEDVANYSKTIVMQIME